jgi:hypothetical protein
MVIGSGGPRNAAAGIYGQAPTLPAIKIGTTIAGISGTTVTLSEPAQASGTSLYCAACDWLSLGGSVANV